LKICTNYSTCFFCFREERKKDEEREEQKAKESKEPVQSESAGVTQTDGPQTAPTARYVYTLKSQILAKTLSVHANKQLKQKYGSLSLVPSQQLMPRHRQLL
jgi:hypothetical protein